MKQQFEYCNDSTSIMPGFYESILFSSDDECEENSAMREYAIENGMEPVDHEIVDFDGFRAAVCKRIVEKLIKPMLTEDEEICDSIVFKKVSSPKYYNFTTDKIVCDVNIDLELLKDKIFADEDMKNGFNKYLHNHYSDRSGFWSFVSNNIKEYFEKWEYLDVMIDYYILTKIYESKDVDDVCIIPHYEYQMIEISHEVLYEFMEPVKTEEE